MNYNGDVAYARQKLQSSFIFHREKKRLYFCYEIGIEGNEIIVVGHKINANDKLENIPLSSFDLTPPKLGYVNNGVDAHYVQRMPMRGGGYKQGLCNNNLVADFARTRIGNIHWESIEDTVTGKYPSFKTAIKERLAYRKRAFSHHFAIDRDSNLFWKGSLVGVCEDLSAKFFPKYEWLEERLSVLK